MDTETLLEECAKRAMDPNTSSEDREREIHNICNLKKAEGEAACQMHQRKVDRDKYIIDTLLKIAGAIGTTTICVWMTYYGIGIELENSHWLPTVKDSMKNYKLKMPK